MIRTHLWLLLTIAIWSCSIFVGWGQQTIDPPSNDANASGQEAKSEKKAEVPAIQAIIDSGRDSHVQDFLNALCNRVGPRLTGSEGLQAGCEWARDEFEKMGLKNCRLEQWGEFPVGFERGSSWGKVISPKPMDLVFGTNAWTAGTKGRVAGSAIMAPTTLEEFEQVKDKLSGAWVLSKRQPRRRRGPPAADAPAPPVEQAPDLREQILKCNPAGIIQPNEGDLILTGGNYNIEWEDLPTIPQITLLQSQWEEISKMLEEGQAVELGFDIRNFFRKGPIPLYNVIAEIPGTEIPQEYVVVGGHIDSWDGATGATDNGSGVATTMEAARILMAANAKPKRTIRFMLWSGEEQGLMGSRAFVQKNPEFVDKVSCVLVHDGGTNYVSGITAPADMKADFEQVFAPAMRLDERAPFEIASTDVIQARGASDHASFIQGGAPGFFWRQAGRAVYRNTHHTQYDTYDSVVPEYQEHSSIVIAIGALGIADLDHMLSRESVEKR